MLRHCTSSHHQHQQQHRHHQSIAAAAPDTMAAASTNFSLFFPLHTNKAEFAHVAMAADGFDDDSHSSVTTSPSSPSSSSTGSVDCTLSLGTPSSRRAAAETAKQRAACLASCGTVSWDVAATADQSYCCCCCCQGGSRPSPAAEAMNKGAAVPCAGHGQQDPMLVDRRCANCGTSSTPLWRNGPRGPKSLCNACGIRFKKEERRAAATATAAAAMDQGGCAYFAQRAQYGAAAAAAAGRAAPVPYGGCEGPAFPCGGDIVTDAEAVPPQFLAWRLDVVAPAQAAAFAAVWPERTTLFQYN